MDSERSLFKEILVTKSSSYCTSEGDKNGILTSEEEDITTLHIAVSDHFCIILSVSSLSGYTLCTGIRRDAANHLMTI